MAETRIAMTDRIAQMQDFKQYKELHWEGTFDDYLQIVREKPQVTRNAYQRCYDMIISYGTEEYIDNKKKLVRYNFFKDEQNGGDNAIFGLDIPLMRLVHVLKAASEGYGPEKRVIIGRFIARVGGAAAPSTITSCSVPSTQPALRAIDPEACRSPHGPCYAGLPT